MPQLGRRLPLTALTTARTNSATAKGDPMVCISEQQYPLPICASYCAWCVLLLCEACLKTDGCCVASSRHHSLTAESCVVCRAYDAAAEKAKELQVELEQVQESLQADRVKQGSISLVLAALQCHAPYQPAHLSCNGSSTAASSGDGPSLWYASWSSSICASHLSCLSAAAA